VVRQLSDYVGMNLKVMQKYLRQPQRKKGSLREAKRRSNLCYTEIASRCSQRLQYEIHPLRGKG
jgi:hypothetical protein